MLSYWPCNCNLIVLVKRCEQYLFCLLKKKKTYSKLYINRHAYKKQKAELQNGCRLFVQ